ncbi:unnamed protein product [Rangifer tarandus platyrhynchus]|uniref:Uncharacterized protein n=1 Tax=Rangifer tarandus platyrhynchus TaxID=3082113 RepID=A0ABN8YVF9_RANTA|nr:unnamed protein product [Rangifer tarandus platyrhynchus]
MGFRREGGRGPRAVSDLNSYTYRKLEPLEAAGLRNVTFKSIVGAWSSQERSLRVISINTKLNSLNGTQSDLSSFPFPFCFHQPELTCQSLANSGQWWNCSLSLSPESECWHLAPPCFLGPLVTLVSKRWRPSECLGEDQPGHKIHLRTGHDQVFENATKLPDISGFQVISESTDAR